MVGRRVATFRDQFASPKCTERYRGGKLASSLLSCKVLLFSVCVNMTYIVARPVSITLGMSHSIVLLQNMEYVPPPPPPPPPAIVEPVPKETVEERPERIVEVILPLAMKPPTLVVEEEVVAEPSPVVRGVRELLQLHHTKDDSDK